MKAEQEMVREFHVCAGADIQAQPTQLSFATACLRAELIIEEWKELLEAMGVKEIDGQVFDWDDSEYLKYDRVKVADAIGDLLYVVLGTAVSCGLDAQAIFHEVHRSNMTKFIDGQRRADGKWVKGPGYTPPDLTPYV